MNRKNYLYSSGEFAKLTGVNKRTLHYYNEIGPVPPRNYRRERIPLLYMLSIYRVRTDPYIAQDRSVHRRDQRLLIPPFRRIFYRDDDKKEKADRRVHRTAFICTGFFRTKSREIKNRNVFAARNDRTLYAAREKDHLLIPYFGRIRRRRFFHRRGVLSPPEKIISSL